MKKIILGILFIFSISLTSAHADEVKYNSNSSVSFYGVYTPPEKSLDDENMTSNTNSTTSYGDLPKTGERDILGVPLGLSLIILAAIFRYKSLEKKVEI